MSLAKSKAISGWLFLGHDGGGVRTAKKASVRRPFSKSLTVNDHFPIWLPIMVSFDDHSLVARFLSLLDDCCAIMISVIAAVGFSYSHAGTDRPNAHADADVLSGRRHG
jgi:hypothetical protein